MGFREGQRVRQYVIGGLLAQGGMALVWRAWDTQHQRNVAIKTVADKLIDIKDFEDRFSDEVRRHSALKHPNIVPVFDVFHFESNFCMVMELVQGVSLETMLKNSPGNRLELAFACEIIRAVLLALDHAHRSGIIHRDVKPSNILLDVNNQPHLADFGIAIAVGEGRRTRAGVAVGTSVYMSPEQIRTPKLIDHRTDVYSTGCMFYEMLTGRPPFVPQADQRGDSDFVVKSAHLQEEPVPPHVRVPSIPVDLSELVMHALRKNPSERIAGCGEFLRLLSLTRNVRQRTAAPFDSGAWRVLRYICFFVLLVAALALISSPWW